MGQPSTAATAWGGAGIVASYKEQFPDLVLQQLAEADRDFLKWVPKKDDLEGEGIHVPMRHTRPQGLSRSLAGMQGSHTSSRTDRVFIERNTYYGGVSINTEAVRAARSRIGAFLDVKEREIEDMIKAVSEELERHCWGDGIGSKGAIASITSAVPSVVTLANAADAANFSPYEFVTARQTNGTTRGDVTEQITAVNISAGTITLTTNVVADHSWAATDLLYRGTGFDGGGDDYNSVITGVGAWIPIAEETSGTFLGMDRTSRPEFLQGWRSSYQGSIEETIKKLCNMMSRHSAAPDTIWLSYANWHRLEQELGSRAIRMEGSDTTFGMNVLKYSSPKGTMTVYAGAFCPEGRVYLFKREDWALHHLDGLPHIIDDDGISSLRGDSFDGVAIRARFWAELACEVPKNQGVGILS